MKLIGLLLAAALLLIVACVSSAGAESGLLEVLESTPLNLQPVTIAYTHWAAIKEAVGARELTSQAPLEDRIAFAQGLYYGHAVASAYGWSKLSGHSDAWGFDSTDFEWEALISGTGTPSIYILKLRDDFDIETLVDLFVERGFVQTESHSVPLFSHGVDLSLEWTRASQFSILNTAVLANEKLLILSSSYPAVESFLATRSGEQPSLSERPSALAAVEQLSGLFASYLLVGESSCLRFTPNPLLDVIGTTTDESAIDVLRAWVDSGEPLYLYSALGVGYRYEEERPVGTITFTYTSAEAAEHDFEPRRLLAESGGSAHYERPISQAYFVMESALVDGSEITFVVRPVNDQPIRLFQMVIYSDAPWAACR